MHETTEPVSRVRFGAFELDLRTGELRKGATRLKVPDQSTEILKALLEHRGYLVTREQLRDRLWASDTFVDFEHGLNAAVRRLRDALGDSADTPKYIETLPRRGYRFIGAVDGAPAPAAAAATGTLTQSAQRTHLTGRNFVLTALLMGIAMAVSGTLWIFRRQATRNVEESALKRCR